MVRGSESCSVWMCGDEYDGVPPPFDLIKVQGAKCKVQGAGCRVQGAGCRAVGGAPLTPSNQFAGETL